MSALPEPPAPTVPPGAPESPPPAPAPAGDIPAPEDMPAPVGAPVDDGADGMEPVDPDSIGAPAPAEGEPFCVLCEGPAEYEIHYGDAEEPDHVHTDAEHLGEVVGGLIADASPPDDVVSVMLLGSDSDAGLEDVDPETYQRELDEGRFDMDAEGLPDGAAEAVGEFDAMLAKAEGMSDADVETEQESVEGDLDVEADENEAA